MKVMRSFAMNLAASAVLLSASVSYARENPGHSNNPTSGNAVLKTAAGCNNTTAQTDLDINNVRARIQVGGDMWWDFTNPRYEVPINTGKYCIFAGALWIGGVDGSGNIKVACQTYRQTGNDFWAGPMDTATESVSVATCQQYDRIWKVTKAGVQQFIDDPSVPNSELKDINEWPGNGSTAAQDHFLAPFEDLNNNTIYEPALGEYPKYLLDTNKFGGILLPDGVIKTNCNDYLFGDKTLWWVFNDVGDIHGETGSVTPIGLEVRAQAFGFKTNDEINNMTFYKYQVVNRAHTVLNQTYFGQWVDPDLGDATDDYVGCDAQRGFGYCYNGDANDGTAAGYGDNPPTIGVDFFQGPLADTTDLVDNNRDGYIDSTVVVVDGVQHIYSDKVLPEQINMAKFLYYENTNNIPNGNPNGYADFYNYLQGIWIDGLLVTYGGDGRTQTNPPCNYMFPDQTDPLFTTSWTMANSAIPPKDMRFLQSAGPFTLKPGQVNYVTTGVVWARAQTGGVEAGIQLAKLADDKAQALFDNCFKLVDGPDAPDLAIRELNKEIIISLQNTATDFVELYSVKDPTIVGYGGDTANYKFQGYQIFQLKDATVTVSDFNNPDKARLLFQCDIRDGVGKLVNYDFDGALAASVPSLKVDGADKGIAHTLRVTGDLFASGSNALVNHKTYYYTIVSYAYNNYKTYDPNDPTALDGQKKPYLAGRNNVKTYTAIPHTPLVENNGQILVSEYGSGVSITRREGQGNGGMVLDMTDGSEQEILSQPYRSYHPTYVSDHGPLNVKVYDPTLVPNADFEVRFDTIGDAANYAFSRLNPSKVINSERPIGQQNEQVLPDWGLSALINNVIEAGRTGSVNNGFLESTIEFGDNTKRWLTGLTDAEGLTPQNWIRSGITAAPADVPNDVDQVYEGVVEGTWGPFRQTSNDALAGPKPGPTGVADAQVLLSPAVPYTGTSIKTGISSVDIVITSDQSKWTRSAVIEMGEDPTKTFGNAVKFNLRKSASYNIGSDNSIGATGMGWFPGYAYNLETGERLNIAYGENSSFATTLSGNDAVISQDMKWNPSSTTFLKGADGLDSLGAPVFGGMHYVYVFGHNADNPVADVPMYDSCKFIWKSLDTAATASATTAQTFRRNVWKDAMWVSIPLSVDGKDFLSTDVRVRLRVARTYRAYSATPVLKSNQPLTIGETYYVASPTVTHNGTSYNAVGTSFVAASTSFTGFGTVTTSAPENSFYPLYKFGTSELAATYNDVATAKDALDLINVVPNPYYAYSAYELGTLDNRIRIVNLPSTCTISIFTMNGTLIRRFERSAPANNSEGGDTQGVNPETSVDWDLKNTKGISVASGIYLIHVEAPGLGERTIKWFGVLRPIDLDIF